MNSSSLKHYKNLWFFGHCKICQRDPTRMRLILHTKAIKPSAKLPPFDTHLALWNLATLKCFDDILALSIMSFNIPKSKSGSGPSKAKASKCKSHNQNSSQRIEARISIEMHVPQACTSSLISNWPAWHLLVH